MTSALRTVAFAGALTASVSSASAGCAENMPMQYAGCTLSEFVHVYVPANVATLPYWDSAATGYWNFGNDNYGSWNAWLWITDTHYTVWGLQFNVATLEFTSESLSVPFGEAGAGLPMLVVATAALAGLATQRARAA